VALPVVIFRSYGRVWIRGGIGLLGVLALIVLGGVADVVWFALTGGFAAGLVMCGFLARDVSEGMRNREVWAFVVGVVLSVVAVIGSITAFQVFAPGLVNPNAIRWGSLIVFGGAGIAALAGLVLMFVGRNEPEPEAVAAGETPSGS
jgi:cell shape-determining protein MreD